MGRQVLALSKACPTPKRGQRLRIGGIYMDMLLESLNAQALALRHKRLKANDLIGGSYIGISINVVEGDVLEVI